MGNGAVGGVVLEEFGFGLEGIGHGLVGLDIGLTPVDDTNESELERVGSTRENIQRVGAGVHQIQLCQHTNGTLSLWIDLASKFQTVRVSQIDIGRRDSKNNTNDMRVT